MAENTICPLSWDSSTPSSVSPSPSSLTATSSIYGLNSLSWRFIEGDVWELCCAKWESTETHLEATLPCLLLSSPIEEESLVMLEAEVTNKGALALYGRLGFIRTKRLFCYYLNGVDAFRLKLLFPSPQSSLSMVAGTEGSHWQSDHIPIEECSEVH